MNKSKINLIIFHPYSDIGGADLSISKLINNLDHKKYKIEFICLNKQKIRKYLKKKIKIHIIRSSKTIYSIFKVRKIIKKNLNLNFGKVVFFSNQNFVNVISFFITLGLNRKLKKIVIERNHISELYTYFRFNDLLRKTIIRNLMRLTYRNFDLIIGNSKELSKDLSEYLNLKVKTIYNALPSFEDKKNKYKKFRGKILNIGRLEKQKDQITLIKALNIVIKQIDVELTIIGNGSEYDNIFKVIQKYKLNNKVKILKNIIDPKQFYSKNDLFILSSIYEGFPNVIAESISMNLPVISSSCKSGVKELLMSSRGPDTFSVGNYKELAKKIINHYRNPQILNKKTMKLKKNLKKFNLKNYTESYDNLFSNL